MPEAKTARHWQDRQYTFLSLSNCPACSRATEIWETPTMLLIHLDLETYEPHFSQCPHARSYRIEQQMQKGVI